MISKTYKGYTITTALINNPDAQLTPWAGGCYITAPNGIETNRIALLRPYAFLASKSESEKMSLVYGKWLIDSHLDRGRELF